MARTPPSCFCGLGSDFVPPMALIGIAIVPSQLSSFLELISLVSFRVGRTCISYLSTRMVVVAGCVPGSYALRSPVLIIPIVAFCSSNYPVSL